MSRDSVPWEACSHVREIYLAEDPAELRERNAVRAHLGLEPPPIHPRTNLAEYAEE